MKKYLSLVLILTLALFLSATAFAVDNTIKEDSDTRNADTRVNYNVAPTFTVTIPAIVTLGPNEDDVVPVSVKAENVCVEKGMQVVVRLTGTSGTDNAFTVATAQEAELKYCVKSGGNNINVGDIVLAVDPGNTTADTVANGTASLMFVLDDTIKYAGAYTGTVTFTVSVESKDGLA